jgi:hypothetical protein
MMRLGSLIVVIGLSACAPQPTPIIQGDSAATDALLRLSDVRFFAQTQLARQIADACPALTFNEPYNEEVIILRFGGANQRLVATANGRAVDLERDVATRSLQARYDVTFGDGNLCDVGAGEIARKSALSAVLLSIE